MKVEKYQEIIATTAKYPNEVSNFGVAYCTLGIFDELDELMDEFTADKVDRDKVVKETGDVLWYICALCNKLNISFEEVISTKGNPKTNPLKLFGLVKKYYRDSKELDPVVIKDILINIINPLKEDLDILKIDLEEVMEVNYNKLMERHATGTIQGDGESVEDRKAV